MEKELTILNEVWIAAREEQKARTGQGQGIAAPMEAPFEDCLVHVVSERLKQLREKKRRENKLKLTEAELCSLLRNFGVAKPDWADLDAILAGLNELASVVYDNGYDEGFLHGRYHVE